jgi:hypothetical protein
MIMLRSQVYVEGISGKVVYDFLVNPSDDAYQRWWPGVHLQLHVLRSCPGHVGDLLYMDEYVGTRRLRMQCVVTEAESGRRLVWAMKRLIRLPARLILDLEDHAEGVVITHTIEAGFRGMGGLLDPLLRLYLDTQFARDMDEHAHAEFPMLGRLLSTTS